jgi:hypothetical protein
MKKYRHELKYYINYLDYEILRRRLSVLLSRDLNVNKKNEYHIRSLYFEDMANTALFEKQAGILERKKYRIRIYNLSKDVIKLEKKSRSGQFVNKEMALLTYNQYKLILDGDFSFLRRSEGKLFNEFYYDLVTSNYRPKVIVDYIREPFVYYVNNVRITFDKLLKTGLNSTDMFSNDIMMIDVMEEPKLIMEVKYDHFLPDFIKNIIQIDACQRYAISKYVVCRKYTKHNSWEDN